MAKTLHNKTYVKASGPDLEYLLHAEHCAAYTTNFCKNTDIYH